MKATKEQMIDKADELVDLMAQMGDLIAHAKKILQGTGMIGRRAEAYWLGHIEGFLTEEDRSSTSMQDTINELYQAGE